jgi:hypothetical protein
MPAPTQQLDIPKPKNHPPSKRPAWPRLLLSGEEGAYKSSTAARLSADDRIGGMFWLEVGAGENTAEEYGAIEGVKYRIIDHDGTWSDIYGQLCAHWALAKAAETEGKPPIALSVDAAHGVYGMLSDWGDLLTRRRLEAKIKYDNRDRRDPSEAWALDADLQRTPDIWNSINRRWGQFMAKILTWPGPVVLIAAEKLVTPFVNGQPDAKAPKEWTMDGSPKNLPRQCTAWVRLTRGNPAMVVKLRSAREANAIADGADRPVNRPDFTPSRLIFDWVGCEVGVSRAPEHKELDADQTMPGEGSGEQAGEETADAVARKAPHANDPTRRLLDAELPVAVAWWADKIKQNKDTETPCSEALTVSDRETLGLDLDASITLGQLVAAVEKYWTRHGFGPRMQGPATAAEKAPEASPEASPEAAGEASEAAA